MNAIAISRMALLVVMALPLAAGAQTQGSRRSRSDNAGSTRTENPNAPAQAVASRLAADPIFAIEHELPSLRADLALKGDQGAAWSSFERAVRDAAELARQRQRKLLSARPIDAPAPNAVAVIGAMVDDDRMRSEAMADAFARFRAAYDLFTPEQRSLLDRRVLLALTDPLGTR